MNVEQATYADIARLPETLGNAQFFVDRFDRQKDGKGQLFIAWEDAKPVGVVYLWLEPAEEFYIRKYLKDVPLLTHLEVLPEYRKRGIGTELIAALETYLVELGHSKVALAVRDDNRLAADLYKRLDYVDWGHGKQICFADASHPDGCPTAEPEVCYVMVKQLHSMRPSSDSTFSSLAS